MKTSSQCDRNNADCVSPTEPAYWDWSNCRSWCVQIAKGYRRPFSKSLQGSAIAELISDCWLDDSKSRPSMAEIVTRLQTIEQEMVIEVMERISVLGIRVAKPHRLAIWVWLTTDSLGAHGLQRYTAKSLIICSAKDCHAMPSSGNSKCAPQSPQ